MGRNWWQGRADHLVVVTEDAVQRPEPIRQWLGAFRSCPADGWSSVKVDGYSFHVPAGRPSDVHWLEAPIVRVARD